MATLKKLRRRMDIIVSEVSMIHDIRDREMLMLDAKSLAIPL